MNSGSPACKARTYKLSHLPRNNFSVSTRPEGTRGCCWNAEFVNFRFSALPKWHVGHTWRLLSFFCLKSPLAFFNRVFSLMYTILRPSLFHYFIIPFLLKYNPHILRPSPMWCHLESFSAVVLLVTGKGHGSFLQLTFFIFIKLMSLLLFVALFPKERILSWDKAVDVGITGIQLLPKRSGIKRDEKIDVAGERS